MNAAHTRGQCAVRDEDRRPARLVLDVEVALDEVVAELVRTELSRGGRVHVVLVLPRLGWSSDAALVARRGRRLARARDERLIELACIAGPHAHLVTVSLHRRRWRRRRPTVHDLGSCLVPPPAQEGSLR